MAHICTHHFQNVGVQDEKSLSCFQVVSSQWALEYAEAMGKPGRFLNMTPKHIARRKERQRKQKWRAVKKKAKARRNAKQTKKSECSKKKKASASEHSIVQRKLRPCCGRRYDMTCVRGSLQELAHCTGSDKSLSKEEAVGALGSACEMYSCCQGEREANQVVKLLQCYLAACRASERTHINRSTPKSRRTRYLSMQNYWSGCASTCDLWIV